MTLAQRGTDLDRLLGFYERCVTTKSQIVLIDGAVASGKTELLHSFLDHVAETDGPRLTAVGSRAERTHAFGVIGQLFLDAGLAPETRADIGALLDGHASREAEGDSCVPGFQLDFQIRLARILYTELLTLCADRPLVIAIDDVQHADESSLEVILYLLRRLGTAQLMVVLNEWTSSRPAHPAFRAELLRLPNCHRIQLQLLSEAGVAEVLAAVTDQGTAEKLAPGYHAVCGGNRLLLRGLTEDSTTSFDQESRSLAAEPVTGESFYLSVFACLYRWDGDIIDVARAMAMLGQDSTAAMAARLTGFEIDRVQQCLDTLARSGLSDDGRFRHPAVHNVVLNSLKAEDRVRMHLTVAQLLHDTGLPAVDVARHLVAAGCVREQWSVPVLQEASAQAVAGDDLGFGMECLELGLRYCQDDRPRAAITMAMTKLKWRNQPSAAGRHLAYLHQALTAGHLEARHGPTVMRYLLWQARDAEAHDILHWLVQSDAIEDPAIAADLRQLKPWLTPIPCPKLHATFEGLTDVRIGDHVHSGLAAALALASVVREGPNEHALEQAKQVLASCSLSDQTLLAVHSAINVLIYSGQPDKAKPWCELFLAQARARRAETWQAVLCAVRAKAALYQGDLPDAEQWATAALDHLSPHNWGGFLGYPLGILLMAQTGLGKLDHAVRTMRHAVPEEMYRGRCAPDYLHARGHYFLATKRLQAALADFRRSGELASAATLDLPVLTPWRSDCAQVHVLLGETQKAQELVEEQLRMPGLENPRTRGVSLRILAATQDFDKRPPLLRKAFALLQVAGDAMELLLVLADLSQTHRALGEIHISHMLERRALRVAKECGVKDQFEWLLGGRDPVETEEADEIRPADSLELLSDAERRVADLAARGHTNRQIGKKLYITVSTVEQHLTRVYRKLNVTRRADLPLWMKDDDFEGAQWVSADSHQPQPQPPTPTPTPEPEVPPDLATRYGVDGGNIGQPREQRAPRDQRDSRDSREPKAVRDHDAKARKRTAAPAG